MAKRKASKVELRRNSNGSVIVTVDMETGRAAVQTTAGELIAADDPRVAEMLKAELESKAEPYRQKLYSLAVHILDCGGDGSDLPLKSVLGRPEFVLWVAGRNPDYRPTRMEQTVGALLAERLRRLEDRALRRPAREQSPVRRHSIERQRWNFEKQWRANHPVWKPAEMLKEYLLEYPGDADADATSFRRARNRCKPAREKSVSKRLKSQ